MMNAIALATNRPMSITLVFAPTAREVVEESIELPGGSTVLQALLATGWRDRFQLDRTDVELGIWNRKATLTTVLRDQDRVEVYRPLQVDPKVARRERFGQQGAKRAGLFATRRPGAKSGY